MLYILVELLSWVVCWNINYNMFIRGISKFVYIKGWFMVEINLDNLELLYMDEDWILLILIWCNI